MRRISLCIFFGFIFTISYESLPFSYYEILDYRVASGISEAFEGEENDPYVGLQFRMVIPTSTTRFHLCLIEKRSPLSSKLKEYHVYASRIKLYEGHLCDDKNSSVFGTVVNNVFHGSIKLANYTYFFEDIGKYKSLWDKCNACHTVMYSSDSLYHTNLILNYDPIDSCEGEECISYLPFLSNVIPIINPYAIYCDLTIIMHHSYFSGCNGFYNCLAVIMRHISKLNEVLAEQIRIKGSVVIQYQITKVNVFRQKKRFDKFLNDPSDLINQLNQYTKKFETCSTGLYVNSDMWNDVIGLGAMAYDEHKGLCNNNAVFMINSYNQRKFLTDPIHMATTIHEIGHNLGSYHDPHKDCESGCFPFKRVNECSPGGYKNFVMSKGVSEGLHENNFRFSPCSIERITELLKNPNRRSCFSEKKNSICGNGVIEEYEECDPGDMADSCCGSPTSKYPCRIIKGTCSPSQGPCCSVNCNLVKKGVVCQNKTECTDMSVCSGRSPKCPPMHKNEGQFCNNFSNLCLEGECKGSLCGLEKKIQCECTGKESCNVCCRDPNENECKHLMINSHNNMSFILPKGTECSSGMGRCNELGKCIMKNIVTRVGKFISSKVNGYLRLMIHHPIQSEYLLLLIIMAPLVITSAALTFITIKNNCYIKPKTKEYYLNNVDIV